MWLSTSMGHKEKNDVRIENCSGCGFVGTCMNVDLVSAFVRGCSCILQVESY